MNQKEQAKEAQGWREREVGKKKKVKGTEQSVCRYQIVKFPRFMKKRNAAADTQACVLLALLTGLRASDNTLLTSHIQRSSLSQCFHFCDRGMVKSGSS